MTDYSERTPDVPSSDPMLLCCACERQLDNPQRLRCLHSFCLSCLQPSIACAESDLQTATTTVTCPICHVSSEVTRNQFLESRVSRHKAIAKSNLCGMCADKGDEDQLAKVWCTSCSMSFCETCLPNHRSYHKAHSTILIDDVKSWDEVFPTPSPLCSSHTKPFDFVCLSCKVFCCSGCWPSCDKLKHDIRHVSDPTVSRYLEKAKEDVSSATHVLLRKAKILSRRKQLEAALESDFINDLKKLQKAKQQLITVIRDVCFTVEQRLMDTYDGLRATAEAISRSSETMERKVDRAATYGRYVVDVGLPSELITQEHSLLSRIKSLCSELDQLEQPLDAGQYVSFDSPLLADQEQLVYLVTSWIGLPRAMTDDLCVRKAHPDMKLASVTVESGCLESNLMEEPKMEKFEALLTPTEYMLTCCLCNRLVQFSVLLNCLHTCCSQCFSTAASRSAVGDVACGACSTITQAGSEQPNRFVDSQVLLFSTSAESKKCQACRDREHIKDAAVWCPACQLLLCADCSEWHRLFKEDHCTESLSELPQTLFSACPIHNETLDACVDCQQTKCRHCCRECSERKHTILAIGDDTFNGYVRDLIASISSTEKELNRKFKAHEKPHIILSILNSVRADHLQQIMSRRQRAREAVKGVYDRIECSTTQAYRELEMEVALTAAKTDHIELNFNNARSYFQRLVNSKRMHDIFDQHKIILKHLNVLCAQLDQVVDTICKNRTTNIELSLPEDMENVVRAGIGEPLLHTVADDFRARLVELKASSTSTEPGASSTAAMSIQAKLSSGSAAAVASAATATDYISGVISMKPSSNESSSSEQAAQQNVQKIRAVYSSPRTRPVEEYPRIPAPLPTVDSIRHDEGTSSAATSDSRAKAATPANKTGFFSFLREKLLSREAFSSEPVIGVADSGDTPAEEEPLEDFKKFLKRKGLNAEKIIAEFRRRLKEWEKIPLNIAVIGNSGSGKSTFINTLRRLKSDDPGAARCGVTETINEPTPYESPVYRKVKFWDLPGCGTKTFPPESYLEKTRFHEYDAFIIVSCSRMCESDLWLAKQIRSSDKHFYFVRTKVDIDVRNCKEDYPDINEELMLKKLRDHIVQELEEAGSKEPTVFLVSKNPLLYDFYKFEERLICDLQKLKKNVMLLAARSHPEIKKLGRELTLL